MSLLVARGAFTDKLDGRGYPLRAEAAEQHSRREIGLIYLRFDFAHSTLSHYRQDRRHE